MTGMTVDQAFALAAERLAASDAAAALAIGEHILRAAPHHVPALVLADTAARRLGRRDVAAQLTERAGLAAFSVGRQRAAGGDVTGALEAYRRGAAIDPEQTFQYHFAGEALLGLNRMHEAAAAYQRAIRIHAEDLPSLFRLADLYGALNMWTACRATLRLLFRHAPAYGVAHTLAATAALMAGRPDDALTWLGRAARLGESGVHFDTVRGLALRDLGDWAGALAALGAALAAHPERADLWFNAAVCATRAAVPESPDSAAQAATALAAARAAATAGDLREASQHYVRAVSARPGDPVPADAHLALLDSWRERLRDDTVPVARRNPDWVFVLCQRAETTYRRLLFDHPEYSGLPGTVPPRPAGGTRRVWDGFMFNTELDLLELRLHELAGVVDRFVIVESLWNHQGRRKDLVFHENRQRFAAFADRIVHVVVEDRHEGVPWEQETSQRNAMLRGLDEAADTDLLIVSDVDEIPRAGTIRRIAGDDRLAAQITGLSVTNFGYFMNFASHYPLVRPLTMPCGLARRFGPSQARSLLVRTGMHIVPVVEDAGWHFSWLGGTEAVWQKMQSFCHLELLPSMPTRDAIGAMLAAGNFRFFSAEIEGRFVLVDRRFPAHVLDNLDRFRRLGWVWPATPA